jgi:hypothetical protein
MSDIRTNSSMPIGIRESILLSAVLDSCLCFGDLMVEWKKG